MTPAARLSAAIEILDRILAGAVIEQALTNWGRANRFAGSGDRHALRDLVYDALRCKRSFAAKGGAETGRGLILGGLRDSGIDPAPLFSGVGHAPAPIGPGDDGQAPEDMARLDCPDWLAPRLQAALGADFEATMLALRQRAPVFLRVNTRKATHDQAQAVLADEGIETQPHPQSKTALQVTSNARKIQNSSAYLDGLVELQDVASQAVVDSLPLHDGKKVLDYCCGGGGKTLAMAARARLNLWAHDADPRRMRDLPARATRAGITINIHESQSKTNDYDLILTDVPCSGSGSWRRDPQGKWGLTEARLQALCKIQADILDTVAPMVVAGGILAYATCSMLSEENEQQVIDFTDRHPEWKVNLQQRFSPLQGGDGFFISLLTREV